MPIDQTIPGGYYIGADGLPHDANGKPLAVPMEEPALIAPAPEPPPAPAEPKPAPRKGKK